MNRHVYRHVSVCWVGWAIGRPNSTMANPEGQSLAKTPRPILAAVLAAVLAAALVAALVAALAVVAVVVVELV